VSRNVNWAEASRRGGGSGGGAGAGACANAGAAPTSSRKATNDRIGDRIRVRGIDRLRGRDGGDTGPFFGIAFLNLAFAWTVRQSGWRPPSEAPGVALAAAELLMPLVCYLAAWRQPMRRLFFAPVACVLFAVVALVLGRVIP